MTSVRREILGIAEGRNLERLVANFGISRFYGETDASLRDRTMMIVFQDHKLKDDVSPKPNPHYIMEDLKNL